MSQNSATKRFSKGPKIAVHVVMEGNSIVSSTLTLSNHFQCTGAHGFILDWLESYSQAKAAPIPLVSGTPFQRKVLAAIASIPFGKVLTYVELAKACGTPRGARAIGNACGSNPFPLFVPCHRVIRSNGSLGGFASDIEIKKRLLEFEKDAF
ncbi:MAG: methylated-DNA--[protein]-cysteine S-methyltransferase [Parachlamydiales bacterium]|nr:methylated-DNA--[protein]-cysteine S-methyltransferase [Parachlamydiales bacterium]